MTSGEARKRIESKKMFQGKKQILEHFCRRNTAMLLYEISHLKCKVASNFALCAAVPAVMQAIPHSILYAFSEP